MNGDVIIGALPLSWAVMTTSLIEPFDFPTAGDFDLDFDSVNVDTPPFAHPPLRLPSPRIVAHSTTFFGPQFSSDDAGDGPFSFFDVPPSFDTESDLADLDLAFVEYCQVQKNSPLFCSPTSAPRTCRCPQHRTEAVLPVGYLDSDTISPPADLKHKYLVPPSAPLDHHSYLCVDESSDAENCFSTTPYPHGFDSPILDCGASTHFWDSLAWTTCAPYPVPPVRVSSAAGVLNRHLILVYITKAKHLWLFGLMMFFQYFLLPFKLLLMLILLPGRSK
jgi:hypothetical protein